MRKLNLLYKPKTGKPLTQKQFDARVTKLVKGMQAEAKPFADTSEEASRKRRERGENDFEWWKMTYFPHYCIKPSGEIHHELHEICCTGNKSLNAVAFPREHAKSTNCTFLELIHKAVYLSSRYSIALSDTQELAKEFISWIKIEAEDNERLKADFGKNGELKLEGWWRDDDIVLQTREGQARIRGMGHQQKIRGTRFMMWRPQYIVIDDLENNTNVRNKALVKEKVRWILGAVYASMADDGTLVMIGTTLDKISVLTLLIEHIRDNKVKIEKRYGISAMNAIVYSAIKEDGTPLWPEAKTIEKLMQIKETVGEDVWLREFMNMPPDRGEFKLEWMKDFDRDVILHIPSRYAYFSGTDLSAGEDEGNDYKATVVIARNYEKKKWYTVHAWIRHCTFLAL